MAKQEKVTGVLSPPDYEMAAKIFRNDVMPASTEMGRCAKDASDAYKEIKKSAHVHPWAVRQCKSLLKNDDAERDVKLRDLRGMMKVLGIRLRPELVDLANGANPDDEVQVIPVSETSSVELHTVN